jgi:hypothetical protein
MRTTMWRPSLKTGRKISTHPTNKIEANKTGKTIDHKTTIETTINNNGGQGRTTISVQTTTPTETN